MEWNRLNGTLNAIEARNTSSVGDTALLTIDVGSSNAKGGYTPVASGFDYDLCGIALTFIGTANQDVMLDLSLTSGSMTPLIEGVLVSLNTNVGAWIFFPLQVKAGSTLFARAQSPAGAATPLQMGVHLFQKGWMDMESFARCTTYGMNTADSGGEGIDPGATPNTLGAWQTVTSGTVYQADTFLLIFGDRNNTNMTEANFLFDVGIGGVGQEIPIFRGAFSANANDDVLYPISHGPIPITIPANTRVSVRAQSTTADATDRLIDVILYAFD